MMSVEAYSAETLHGSDKLRAVETAVESIVRLRALITEAKDRLANEEAAESVDAVMVAYLRQCLQELTDKVQDSLAFLEEFDPILYQKLKDNS